MASTAPGIYVPEFEQDYKTLTILIKIRIKLQSCIDIKERGSGSGVGTENSVCIPNWILYSTYVINGVDV